MERINLGAEQTSGIENVAKIKNDIAPEEVF